MRSLSDVLKWRRMLWTENFVMARDELDKRYYRIGDVSEMLDLPLSTLRFWESKFTFIRPFRDSKGNRYYTPRNVELLQMVKYLLKERGLKIEAAQAELNRNRAGVEKRFAVVQRLKGIKEELEKMLKALDDIRHGGFSEAVKDKPVE